MQFTMKAVRMSAVMATMSFAAAAAPVTTAAAQPANVLNIVGQAQVSSPGAGSGFPLFIDFLSGAAFPPATTGNGVPGNVFSGNATGLFSSIAGGTRGTIQDLTVAANGASTATNPSANAASFMTIGGYTFTLTNAPSAGPGAFNFGPISLADATGGATATFAVNGLVSGPGFAAGSMYTGLFTAQFVNESASQVFNQINNGGSPVVTFSANFSASTVPEPSTYALLGTGLAGLLAAARRRRSNA